MIRTPSEAAADGQPAPPADGLAENQRRAHGDGERQRLQDGRHVGKRHMGERDEEEHGRGGFGHDAQKQQRLPEMGAMGERAALPGDQTDEDGGEEAAHQHHLAHVHVGRHHLGDGVVDGEAGHRDRHEKSAAKVGGDGHALILKGFDAV